MYYNCEQYFSIVLQAVSDANCKFIFIEVGAYGKQSDGGTFQSWQIYKLMKRQQLNIPKEERFPNSDITAPFVFIGDKAYPLLKNLMKPFPRVNLNEEIEISNK